MSKISEEISVVSAAMEKMSEIALAEAKKLGADEAKVGLSASFQKRLVVESKEFALANSLEGRSIGIVVHKDKKKGSASTNIISEQSIKQAVADAMALASYSVPDETLTFATRDQAPPAKPLSYLFESALADIELEEMQGSMQEVLALLVRDHRVALDKFEMSVDVSYHGLANSHGVKQRESQTIANWFFFGMARDGEEVTGFDFDGSHSFSKAKLLNACLQDADRFVKKIIAGLKPVQCPSYKGPVLFSPRAFQELLSGMMLYHASGRQVMDGRSKWEKDLGNKVVSEKFTMTDNPHDPLFSGSTAFDSDGLPTMKHTIIDKGVLKMHLHDCYSAKKCGVKSTATSGGPFALDIGAGSDALSTMKSSAKHLLLIDRFSGNDDPVKGDFSGVAKGSRFFSSGKDMGAVTETMIAGNFFESKDKILAVSKEVELVGGGFRAPYVLIDGISVTGS